MGKRGRKTGGGRRSQRRMNKSQHAEGSIYGGHKSVKKKKKSGSGRNEGKKRHDGEVMRITERRNKRNFQMCPV